METPYTILMKANLPNSVVTKILSTWGDSVYDSTKIDSMHQAIDYERSILNGADGLNMESLENKAASEAFDLLLNEYVTMYLSDHNWDMRESYKADFDKYIDEKVGNLIEMSDEKLLKAVQKQGEKAIKDYVEIIHKRSYNSLMLYFKSQKLIKSVEQELGYTSKDESNDVDTINLNELNHKIYKHNVALEAEDVIIDKYEQEKGVSILETEEGQREYDNFINQITNMSDDDKIGVVENYTNDEMKNYEINHAFLMCT